MPRKEDHGNNESTLQRVATAVKRLFSRGRVASAIDGGTEESAMASTAAPRQQRDRTSGVTARPAKREADIPLDVLDRAYTPPRTSSKAGFRADGADHQRDQEFSRGVDDGRWNDEDHLTNKSGDPRIGTHRRTYEPGETRAESRE